MASSIGALTLPQESSLFLEDFDLDGELEKLLGASIHIPPEKYDASGTKRRFDERDTSDSEQEVTGEAPLSHY